MRGCSHCLSSRYLSNHLIGSLIGTPIGDFHNAFVLRHIVAAMPSLLKSLPVEQQ